MKNVFLATCLLTCVISSGISHASEIKVATPIKTAGHVAFLNADNSQNLPFSDGVRVGNLTYFSGMLGIPPGSQKLITGGIKEETKQVLENIKATAKIHGYQMKDMVKCTVMLADISEFGAFNEVYRTFFQKPYPARSTFGVSGLVMDARVEIECIAAK